MVRIRFVNSAVLGLVMVFTGCAEKDKSNDSNVSDDSGSTENGEGVEGVSGDTQGENGTTTNASPTTGSLSISGDLGSAGANTTIVAIAIADGAPSAESALSNESISGDGGAFTLQIETQKSGLGLQSGSKTNSHVLIVTDNSKKRLDQMDDISFITMPVSSDELVGLPTDKAKVEALDLGVIAQQEGGDFRATTNAETTHFDLEAKVLQEFARIDDTLRAAKNSYVNADPDTKVISDSNITFTWKGELTTKLAGDAPFVPTHGLGGFDKATTFPWYYGYTVNVQTNHPAFAFDKFCQKAHKVTLKPPTAGLANGDHCADPTAAALDQQWPCVISEHGDPTDVGIALRQAVNLDTANPSTFYGPNDVYENNHSCNYGYPIGESDSYSISVQHGGGDLSSHTLSFGGPWVFKGDVIPGNWDIEVDDKKVARFDLAVSAPYGRKTVAGAEYSYPVTYIPTFTLLRSANGVVTGAKFAFYLFNFNASDPSSSSFERLTDLGTIKRVFSNFDLSLESNDGGNNVAARTRAVAQVDFSTITAKDGIVTVSSSDLEKFVFPNKGATYDTSKKLVWSGALGYRMFGSSYTYRFRCNSDTTDVECAN